MKIIINGEAFKYDFDLAHVMMAQALVIEKAAGRRYVEWEAALLGGSAEATAVLVVLAWGDGGREVTLKEVLDGKAEFNVPETYASIMNALREQAAARAAAENPTSGAEPLTDPDGTGTTPPATRQSSRKSST